MLLEFKLCWIGENFSGVESSSEMEKNLILNSPQFSPILHIRYICGSHWDRKQHSRSSYSFILMLHLVSLLLHKFLISFPSLLIEHKLLRFFRDRKIYRKISFEIGFLSSHSSCCSFKEGAEMFFYDQFHIFLAK